MKKRLTIVLLLIFALSLFAITAQKPVVWAEKCSGCGDCAIQCPVSAITVQQGKAVIDSELCIDCKFCVTTCTFGAVQ